MNKLRFFVLSLAILVLTSPVMAQQREHDGARRDRSSHRYETRGGDASQLARYANAKGDGGEARRIAAAPLVGSARRTDNEPRDNRASRYDSDRGEGRRTSSERFGVDRSEASVRHSGYSNGSYHGGSSVFVSYSSGYYDSSYYRSTYISGGACGYGPRYGYVYRPVVTTCRPVFYARPGYCYPIRRTCAPQTYYGTSIRIYYRGRF